MLKGFLPGALTAGKPDELFSRLSSEGNSITLSVCLSVCLVQGIGLSTLHVLTKCYNLSYNLCFLAFLLSLKVRCFAPRAQPGSLGWAVKFASGLAVGIVLECSLEHCLQLLTLFSVSPWSDLCLFRLGG